VSLIARRLRRAMPVAIAMLLLLLAACSSQKESTSTGGGSGATSGCANAAQAQQAYNQTWQTAEQQLGLSGLQPPTQNICEVDTSKYKKSPQNGRYKIAFAAQGPTNSWALENEEALKYHAQQRGVDVLYASANGDATKQVDNIQQLASQKPDAMVVVPMGKKLPAGTPVRGFETWADVARFLSEIGDPQADINDAVAAKARELTANAKSELEKVRAIGRYVQNVRYISIQTNIAKGGGYRPHAAARGMRGQTYSIGVLVPLAAVTASLSTCAE